MATDPPTLDRFLAYVRASGRKSDFTRLATVYVVAFPMAQAIPSQGRPRRFKNLPLVCGTMVNRLIRWALRTSRYLIRKPRPTDCAIGARQTNIAERGPRRKGDRRSFPRRRSAEALFLAGINHLRHDRELSALERLTKVTEWSVRQDGRLFFEQHRFKIADALVLLCDVNETVTKLLRDRYFFIPDSRFDDPRLRRGRWSKLEASTPIVRCWLTEQSLRQFLKRC